MLELAACTWINRVLNMPEFWMCLRQCIALGHCWNYWAVTETETHSEHCQTFKKKHFATRTMPECGHATRNFSGMLRFCRTRAL